MMGFKAFSSINSMVDPNFIWENIHRFKKNQGEQFETDNPLRRNEVGDSSMLANESKMEPIDSNHTSLEGIKRANQN